MSLEKHPVTYLAVKIYLVFRQGGHPVEKFALKLCMFRIEFKVFEDGSHCARSR